MFFFLNMYGWLITWSCWRKVLVLKNPERNHHKTSVFPLLYWNKWNLIKRETRTFLCWVSSISTEKSRGLSSFNGKVSTSVCTGSFAKGQEGKSLLALPVTSNKCILHWMWCSQSIETYHYNLSRRLSGWTDPQAWVGNDEFKHLKQVFKVACSVCAHLYVSACETQERNVGWSGNKKMGFKDQTVGLRKSSSPLSLPFLPSNKLTKVLRISAMKSPSHCWPADKPHFSVVFLLRSQTLVWEFF